MTLTALCLLSFQTLRTRQSKKTNYSNVPKFIMIRYTALKTLDVEGIWKSVGVPSRMYSTPSQEKPLAGKRISIKENFRLAGVKTTMSNRAFTELYGPDEETSTFVQQLIDMGAVIVGKTKLSAFASSEEPTDQWIDFHAPFNPRGDGFQSPAGSTGGGAAAVAGYPWLDYSLGTDSEYGLTRQ